MFEPNLAEMTTFIHVVKVFQKRHSNTDRVVADAGVLLANNLNAIEDSEFKFSSAPACRKRPTTCRSNRFSNAQVLERICVMGAGKNVRERKALAVAEDKSLLKNVPFLKVTLAGKELNEKIIMQASMLVGMKGCATNLSVEPVPATQMNSAYISRSVADGGIISDDEVEPAGYAELPP